YAVFSPPQPEWVKPPVAYLMEDSIETIREEITRIESLIIIEQEVLNKTGILIETTISTSGNKTVTSAEVLKLVDYYNDKIEKAKTKIYNHQQSKNKLTKKITEIQKRVAALKPVIQQNAKPYGQLYLQVFTKRTGEIPVSVSYYTQSAGWVPVYDIRVNSKTNKVKLIYKASLTQTSGVDWKKTKLTLSTGTPNFGVAAPVLSPWYLQLYVPELYKALQGRAAGVGVMGNTIQSMNDDAKLSEVVVTGHGIERKEKELNFQAIDPSTMNMYTTLNEGQLNTNFEIELPYDIDSDGKMNSIAIKEEEIVCTLKNYAVPRIDKESYLMAEVADWQNLDLLPGDANIIMDETYIGKSIIDPNSIADTLNLSLGRDKRVVVKRSVVKELSSLKTNGNSSRQNFTYEIVVKNNKQTDINLLLKDQFPLTNIKEVEVSLENSGDAMVNAETGVLTWKLNLKPGESKKVRFSYSVNYPKDKKIINIK
ncbi:MAG TPA: mucoidy inhibitor MuiA family protein, partial [Chitinophagaceae bacterium]